MAAGAGRVWLVRAGLRSDGCTGDGPSEGLPKSIDVSTACSSCRPLVGGAPLVSGTSFKWTCPPVKDRRCSGWAGFSGASLAGTGTRRPVFRACSLMCHTSMNLSRYKFRFELVPERVAAGPHTWALHPRPRTAKYAARVGERSDSRLCAAVPFRDTRPADSRAGPGPRCPDAEPIHDPGACVSTVLTLSSSARRSPCGPPSATSLQDPRCLPVSPSRGSGRRRPSRRTVLHDVWDPREDTFRHARPTRSPRAAARNRRALHR